MSIIAAGTTTTTALSSTGNTDGTLQLQVNGTTPSVTLNTLGAVGVGSTPSYGTSGQVLTSGGSTVAPAWSTPAAVSLTTGVTGTLPIANGGTGTTSTTFVSLATNVTGTLPIANGGTNSTATATAGGIGYGTGTAHAYTSAGTSGQVLQSAGAGTPVWATLSAGNMSVFTANGASVPVGNAFLITSTSTIPSGWTFNGSGNGFTVPSGESWAGIMNSRYVNVSFSAGGMSHTPGGTTQRWMFNAGSFSSANNSDQYLPLFLVRLI